MTLRPEYLGDFASLQWATAFLKSPDWFVRQRMRVPPSSTDFRTDRYVRDTMRSYDGVQTWLELYEKPALGSKVVKRSLSLCKFGPGLMGLPTVCHGGVVMTMFDDAFGFAVIANHSEAAEQNIAEWGVLGDTSTRLLESGRPIEEFLVGHMVTARMETRFLKPVPCPGVVGIEVTVLEIKDRKITLSGVMKDVNGTPLARSEALFVKLAGAAKI